MRMPALSNSIKGKKEESYSQQDPTATQVFEQSELFELFKLFGLHL